jgi:hypothetical protein
LNVVLSGDFFNLTNHGNVYSNPNNPNTATISLATLTGCTPNFTPAPPVGGTGTVTGAAGQTCAPLTAATMPRIGQNGFRAITEIAPGSTPFAFQAGVKFVF